MATADCRNAAQLGQKLPYCCNSWRLLLLLVLSAVLLQQQHLVSASSSNVYNTTASR
jgi:hypothetical protein